VKSSAQAKLDRFAVQGVSVRVGPGVHGELVPAHLWRYQSYGLQWPAQRLGKSVRGVCGRGDCGRPCAWRIPDSSAFPGFVRLLRLCHARPGCPASPPLGDCRPARPSGRGALSAGAGNRWRECMPRASGHWHAQRSIPERGRSSTATSPTIKPPGEYLYSSRRQIMWCMPDGVSNDPRS
jgi:hypothetical protein